MFGYEQLRAGQAEAMASLVAGRDVLLVLPTGAGKSAVYQIPAVILRRPTVVVSPLIALQRDQVAALQEVGGQTRAHAVSSAASQGQRRAAFADMRAGQAEFLFLAPEQLANDEVLARVRALRPSFVAVDEAHCVSAWGHDFRPDYLRLGEFLDALGHPRVVALTATAAPPVREDIVERLHLRDPHVIVRGFAPSNIALGVVRVMSDAEKREAVLLRAAAEVKPGVVYTGTRREAEEYAAAVAELGLAAAAYHGGLRTAVRNEVQHAFMGGELDVIVATSAFGMGIDKPDIRFVLHATVPDSPDSYYQETGRAGRDGKAAHAVLFYRPEDLGLRRFFASAMPDAGDIEVVADALVREERVTRRRLGEITGFGPRKLGRILNLLSEVEPTQRRNPPEASRRAVAVAESHRRLEQSRIEMMRRYAETTGCRRQFLLGYFGEHLPEPCGNCDTCRAGAGEAVDQPRRPLFPLQSRVRHPEFGTGMVMSYDTDPDRVTVLFDEAGYRTLALAAVRDHALLAAV